MRKLTYTNKVVVNQFNSIRYDSVINTLIHNSPNSEGDMRSKYLSW